LEQFEESGLFARCRDQTEVPVGVGEQDASGGGVEVFDTTRGECGE